MDEIVKDFLIESKENLDRLDQELVQLESDPARRDLLASIFRTIHTIKGTCSFLGFCKLEKLTHAGETLLSKLREGELEMAGEVTSGLLAMVDAVRRMLASIQDTGQDGTEDYASLIARLSALPPHNAVKQESSGMHFPGASVCPAQTQRQENRTGDEEHSVSAMPNSELATSLKSEDERMEAAVAADGKASTEESAAMKRDLNSTSPETVRIGVPLLDRIMNFMGELVLARNQLLQFTQHVEDSSFLDVSQRINRITTELQQNVMKTRMQPIASVWNKFPRTVRDLARACGKEVRLEMEGQDTELDRTIIESIKDPLTHLVRNCIDHGIELPESRRQAGKDSMGTLRLRAFHAGGQVNIEVSDDGAGLDRERIRQKAVERNLLSAQHAAHMSERELLEMIFVPGFSTATKVTNVSGRGVGMDVVKTRIEKIGGIVEVQSEEGKGTKVVIKLPLTLAIMPALLVHSGGERFAIPQAAVLELVRHQSGDPGQKWELICDTPVYRLRGRLLPLVSLNQELQLLSSRDEKAESDCPRNVVILQADGCEFGLVVDEILDTEEIVVKPLSQQLNGIRVYCGATVLGDGRIALILDIAGLARAAHVMREANELAETKKATQEKTGDGPQFLLLVESSSHTRMAIPVLQVVRLQDVSCAAIEKVAGHEIMQYAGEIVPLLRLGSAEETLPNNSAVDHRSSVQVVVCFESGRNIGLIVDRVVDIAAEDTKALSGVQSVRTPGATLIGGRITELLDMPALVRDRLPEAIGGGN